MAPKTSPTEPNNESRSIGSTIAQDDWQDKEASCDSQLKAIFDEEMGKYEKNRFTFRKAAVLLLSWAENFDDLNTGPEVDELEHVFKGIFKFETCRKSLGHADKTAQAQVNFFLSSFVHDYDDHNTLLIVYYAGHGWRSESKDGLLLKGETSANGSEFGQVVWKSADGIINETKSHVLVIFDCCHAGALKESFRGNPIRAFEYLAATSSKGTTRQPGPRSFTAALIHALKSLKESGKSFSIPKLLSQIMTAPDFPKDQIPRYFERPLIGVSCRRSKIMLAPLNSIECSNEPQIEDDTSEPRQSIALGLRFIFQNDLDNEKDLVKRLAAGIRILVSGEHFPPTTVLWDGSTPNSINNYVVGYYAHKWKSHSRKSSRRNSVSPVGLLPRIKTTLPVSPREPISLSVTTPDKVTSDVYLPSELDAEHSGTDTALITPVENDSVLERAANLQILQHVGAGIGKNVEPRSISSSDNGSTRQLIREHEPEFAYILELLSLKIRSLFRRFIAWISELQPEYGG